MISYYHTKTKYFADIFNLWIALPMKLNAPRIKMISQYLKQVNKFLHKTFNCLMQQFVSRFSSDDCFCFITIFKSLMQQFVTSLHLIFTNSYTILITDEKQKNFFLNDKLLRLMSFQGTFLAFLLFLLNIINVALDVFSQFVNHF